MSSMHYTTHVTNCGDLSFSGALNRVHCTVYEPIIIIIIIQCRARAAVVCRGCCAVLFCVHAFTVNFK